MFVKITDECINCGACAVECPTEAIFEPGENSRVEGIDYPTISNEHFYIITDLCNKCFGLNLIKCISICPMKAIIKT